MGLIFKSASFFWTCTYAEHLPRACTTQRADKIKDIKVNASHMNLLGVGINLIMASPYAFHIGNVRST